MIRNKFCIWWHHLYVALEFSPTQVSRGARWKKWLIWAFVAFALFNIVAAALFMYARRRFEPTIRQLAVEYLEEHFNSQVELARLRVDFPGFNDFRAMVRGRATMLTAEGELISLRHMGRTDIPPMFKLKKFSATFNLKTLYSGAKIVPLVVLDGMEINLPPKGERPNFNSGNKPAPEAPQPDQKPPDPSKKGSGVVVEQVLIRDAKLTILPRDPTRVPLQFDLYDIRLTSAGKDVAMKYEAYLTNPKPKGEIHSTGTFGPWASGSPSDTPLSGTYLFENADLGVFNGIAGILKSTGTFEGTLGSINASGEATVPDFRLKMSGNPIPLQTTFEVLVDGTNGNTILQPVHATLGSTKLTTSGGIVRHIGDKRKTIDLEAHIPAG